MILKIVLETEWNETLAKWGKKKSILFNTFLDCQPPQHIGAYNNKNPISIQYQQRAATESIKS